MLQTKQRLYRLPAGNVLIRFDDLRALSTRLSPRTRCLRSRPRTAVKCVLEDSITDIHWMYCDIKSCYQSDCRCQFQCLWFIWTIRHHTNLVFLLLLLYLISKSVHVIGQNHVTWRSINLTSALARHFLPSLIMHVSFHFSKQQNHSTDTSKSQFFASYVYLLS